MKKLVTDKGTPREEQRTWAHSIIRPGRMLVAVGVLALAGSSALAAFVIDFETGHGFPGTDGASFNGLTNAPADVVNKLTSLPNNFGETFGLVMDHRQGEANIGDEPAPVSGTQITHMRSTDRMGAGVVTAVVEKDLINSANLGFVRFWYANRGTFPPLVTVAEYFGLNELSLGFNTFTGAWAGGVGVGLDFGFNPKFQMLTTTDPFQGVTLSKMVITSGTSRDMWPCLQHGRNAHAPARAPEPSALCVVCWSGSWL
jgi:hypothetical protein